VADVSKGLRVAYPEPLLQCPDLAKSQAFTKSATFHPNWEWEVMVDALVNHKDLAPLAQQVVNGRQQILDQGLQQDQTKGLKVSKSCYAFSSWDYSQNFDPANYPKS